MHIVSECVSEITFHLDFFFKNILLKNHIFKVDLNDAFVLTKFISKRKTIKNSIIKLNN